MSSPLIALFSHRRAEHIKHDCTISIRTFHCFHKDSTAFHLNFFFLYLDTQVDRLDDGGLLANSSPPFDPTKCDSYEKLYQAASKSVFRAHVTSKLKSEVLANPAKFIELDDCLVNTCRHVWLPFFPMSANEHARTGRLFPQSFPHSLFLLEDLLMHAFMSSRSLTFSSSPLIYMTGAHLG
jgi:hypothetical protein